MLSNLPQAVAAGSNLVTQIGTGWSKSDTSAFLAWDYIKKAGDTGNNSWEERLHPEVD